MRSALIPCKIKDGTMIDCFAAHNSFWIDPQGHVRPCARYKEKMDHITTFNSFSDIVNSKGYVEIRQSHSKDQWPSGCFRCKEDEEKNLHSKRQFYQDIELKQPDDFMIDISMGNYCNLKCRMCGPNNSTSWNSDFKFLVDNNISVMGHIGLLPQRVNEIGGYRYQGRDENSAQEIFETALELEKAGAFSIVIEAVPADLATKISQNLKIPTIGIGASADCDGQVLVIDDLLGLNQEFKPKFVTHYENLSQKIDDAVKKFSFDVKSKKFPAENNLLKNKS